MNDVINRLQHDMRGRTHWEGCEETHTRCAAIKEIERLSDEVERKNAAIVELWVLADTSDLEPETSLYVGGIVAESMERDNLKAPVRSK